MPGTAYQLSFNLFGDDYVLAEGHRRGLAATGSVPLLAFGDGVLMLVGLLRRRGQRSRGR